MRTTILIDDDLMAEALEASGFSTKKEAVEQGLKFLIQRNRQTDILKLRGAVNWNGDLDDMRTNK